MPKESPEKKGIEIEHGDAPISVRRSKRSAAAHASDAWKGLATHSKNSEYDEPDKVQNGSEVITGSQKRVIVGGPNQIQRTSYSNSSPTLDVLKSEPLTPKINQLQYKSPNIIVKQGIPASVLQRQQLGKAILIRPQQKTRTGTAMSKEQLRVIEREIEKHQFESPHNDDDSGVGENGFHKQQIEHSIQQPKAVITANRTAAVRGRPPIYTTNVPSRLSGSVRVQTGPLPAGVIQGRIQKPTIYQQQRAISLSSRPVYKIHSNVPSRPTIPGQIRIVRAGNGMKTVVGQSVKPMVNLRQPVQQSNPTYSSLVKEFDDISEKYKDRIIPGSTVNEFNSIINQLSNELTRVVEEHSRFLAYHRDYVENLSDLHASEVAIKDRRVQQLEQQIEALQAKLLFSYKRNQMNLIKHGTVMPEPQRNSATILTPQQQSNAVNVEQIHENAGGSASHTQAQEDKMGELLDSQKDEEPFGMLEGQQGQNELHSRSHSTQVFVDEHMSHGQDQSHDEMLDEYALEEGGYEDEEDTEMMDQDVAHHVTL